MSNPTAILVKGCKFQSRKYVFSVLFLRPWTILIPALVTGVALTHPQPFEQAVTFLDEKKIDRFRQALFVKSRGRTFQ